MNGTTPETITAHTVILPLPLIDPSLCDRRLDNAALQQARLDFLDKRTEHVKRNIIALTQPQSTPVNGDQVRPRIENASKVENDHLIRALHAQRPSGPNPKFTGLRPDAVIPPPKSNRAKLPGAVELDRTVTLLVEADRAAKEARATILGQRQAPRPPSNLIPTGPAAIAPSMGRPLANGIHPFAPICGSNGARPSSARRMTSGPGSMRPHLQSTVSAPTNPQYASTTSSSPIATESDMGGRRQSMEPGTSSRRREMLEPRTSMPNESNGDVFIGGRLVGRGSAVANSEGISSSAGGSVVDRSRDPRQRRSTGGA